MTQQLAERIKAAFELDAMNKQTVFPDKTRLEMVSIISELLAIVEKQHEALENAQGGLGAASAMLPYGGQLLAMAHGSVESALGAVADVISLSAPLVGLKVGSNE